MKLYNRVIALFVLSLLFSMVLVVPTDGAKIHKNDTWLYDKSDRSKVNERALDVFEYTAKDGSSLSLVEVNTTRYHDLGYLYTYNDNGVSMELNMTPITDTLVVTQLGGFPVFNRGALSGYLSYNYNSSVNDYRQVNNKEKSLTFGGNPARILTTGENERYTVDWRIDMGSSQLNVFQEWLLNSNDDIGVNKFNVTFTLLSYNIVFSDFSTGSGFSYSLTPESTTHEITWNSVVVYRKTVGLLSLSAQEPSIEYTYESGFNIPTLIKQVEPVRIETGLSLNQVDNQLFEYVLDRPVTSSELSTTTITTSSSDNVITSENNRLDVEPVMITMFIIFIGLIIIWEDDERN